MQKRASEEIREAFIFQKKNCKKPVERELTMHPNRLNP